MTRDEMDALIGAATVSATDRDGFIDEARDLQVAFLAGIEAAAAWHDDEVRGLGTGAPDTAQVHARSARALRRLAYQLAKTT